MSQFVISNSEVTDYLKCKRKFYYAHILKIKPKSYSKSLTRGIIGHEALAAYYERLRETHNYEVSKTAAMQVLSGYLMSDPEMIQGLMSLISEYSDAHQDLDEFEILEVEKSYRMPLGDDLDYAMRLDLLVKYHHGPYAGETVLIDHKFVYNFWTEDDLTLNAQIPKYLGTLRVNGYNVNKGIINQLRWREVKSNPERFRKNIIKPSQKEVYNVLQEQATASQEIILLKSYDNPEDHVLRTMEKFTCQHCQFLMLCKVDLTGEDSTVMRRADFMPNDYGYVEDDDS